MANGFYLILAIAVGLAGIVYGFRHAATGQLSSILGFAFGVVAARVFTPQLQSHFIDVASRLVDDPYIDYAANVICASVIYICVYFLFSLFKKILRGAMSVFEVGMFNRLVGAFFSLTVSLLWVSIAYSVLICISPDCGLLNYERADDGNLGAAVMAMTPAILGCQGADHFAHIVQLQHAATISCNFNDSNNVISIKEITYCNVKDSRS